MMKQIAILLGLVLPSYLIGQVKVSDSFEELLATMEVDFAQPTEVKYKSFRPRNNDWVDYQFGMKSRAEKLEILTFLKPELADQQIPIMPQVECMRMVTHLATNNQDALIAGHNVEESTLEDLRADWAKVFFFTPKKAFSFKENCKLLAFYKEGRGMVFVFYLFDEATQALDYRLETFSFY